MRTEQPPWFSPHRQIAWWRLRVARGRRQRREQDIPAGPTGLRGSRTPRWQQRAELSQAERRVERQYDGTIKC